MKFRNLLATAVVVGTLLIACDREPERVDRSDTAAANAAPLITDAATPAEAATGAPKAFRDLIVGSDYELIDSAPDAADAGGRITVAEAFSYACGHCAHFEPVLAQWVDKLPADVEFEAVPMPLNPVWTEFARAHYAALDLGVGLRTHRAIFEALHTKGVKIDSVDALSQWFAAAGGVENSAFRTAMTSSGTDARIEGARARAERWGIASTPTLVIDERYRVLGFGTEHGGFPRTLAVADLLIAEVRKTRASRS